MLNYVTGDVTQPTERPVLVAHVVNDIGRFGAGVSGAIGDRWPQVARDFHAWADGTRKITPYRLGNVDYVWVDPGVVVANMVAQHGVRGRGNPRPIRYDALHECLSKVAIVVAGTQIAVALPKIGAGLAGGSWDEIERIILATVPHATIYELPAASGAGRKARGVRV